MLKIEVKQGENIERALKRYKRKRKKTKLMDSIRDRKHFKKDSVVRRKEIEKAKYREAYLRKQEED